MLTVDTPTIARPKDVAWTKRRSVPMDVSLPELIKFAPQVATKPGWALDIVRSNGVQLPDISMALRADGSTIGFWEGIGKIYEQTPAWEDLPWIRRHWDGPIVLKGILTVEDAERAVREGVDAIVVSNHGGNVLDGSVPTLQALPRIVDAVGDRVEVLMDSGVRRGTDVLKALAFGAKAVLLGRSYVYPLMAAGEPGVRHILELLHRQTEEGLAFLGAESIKEPDRSFLDIPASWARLEDVDPATLVR
ncbi:MAG: alpha-hydroxy-acid oxidizing protein [Actinomycetia bacterium]|nr:alpha-hydroxy-acid oxidizing protein [Actinomycetes bacterium]